MRNLKKNIGVGFVLSTFLMIGLLKASDEPFGIGTSPLYQIERQIKYVGFETEVFLKNHGASLTDEQYKALADQMLKARSAFAEDTIQQLLTRLSPYEFLIIGQYLLPERYFVQAKFYLQFTAPKMFVPKYDAYSADRMGDREYARLDGVSKNQLHSIGFPIYELIEMAFSALEESQTDLELRSKEEAELKSFISRAFSENIEKFYFRHFDFQEYFSGHSKTGPSLRAFDHPHSTEFSRAMLSECLLKALEAKKIWTLSEGQAVLITEIEKKQKELQEYLKKLTESSTQAPVNSSPVNSSSTR